MENNDMRGLITRLHPQATEGDAWKLTRHAAILVLTIAQTFCFSSRLSAQEQNDALLARVLQAWQERQDRTKSLRFRWSGQKTYPKGAIPSRVTSRPGDASKAVTPKEDTTFETHHSLALDGDRIRYHNENKIWSHPRQEFLPQVYDCSYDGRDCKQFWPRGAVAHPKGVLRSESFNVEMNNVNARPVLMTYRAMSPHVQLPHASELRLLKERAILDGHSCLILEQHPKFGQRRLVTMWVDPDRDYSIVRLLSSAEQKSVLQLTVNYRHDPDYGFVPVSWEVTRGGSSGDEKQSSSAVVSEYNLNVPIPLDEFRIDFPPGTVVTDQKSAAGGKRSNEPKLYVAKEGDRKRLITNEELAKATYEQLLTSETGEALKPQPFWKSWMPNTLTVVVLLLTIIAFWLLLQTRLRVKKDRTPA
jgi:hypothetical protein